MNKIILLSIMVSVMAACRHAAASGQSGVAAGQRAMGLDSPAVAAAAFKKIVLPLVDYKKDPACGMPLTTELADTTRYKGKLYGFCSRECKEEFEKNPAGYVAAIKK